jgi:hypothetical protein
MKGNRILHPTVVIVIAALIVGWLAGYLMSDSKESKTQESSPRTGVLNPASYGTSSGSTHGEALRDTAGDVTVFKPVGGNGDPGAQFESLMRGALRITDNTDRVVQLREIARWISPANLPSAVEKAKRLPYSERWQVMQALGARWAEVDPAGAAAFAVKDGGSRYGWNDLLSGIIDKWASIDQQAAVGWIDKQPQGRQQYLMQSLIQSVARRDPESALEILKARPANSQMGWIHQQVFEQWSQRDPAGAARAAEGMEVGAPRERALQSVAASWASQDPAAAIKWTESFSDKAAQNKLLRSVVQSWADNDARAVIQWAGSVPEANLRQEFLGAAISRLAQSDAAAAETQLRAIPPGQERDNLVSQVAYAAANQDPKAALAFVELLPNGPGRTNVTANIAIRLASSDPKNAAEMFLSLPPAQLGYQVEQFVGNLATRNMEFAREWVDQLSDARLRSQAIRAIGGVLARGDPRGAAEWLMQKQPGSDLTWLVNSWVRNSPKDVLAWARELPEGEAKCSAQASVVQNLIWSDLEQARSTFANELSPEAQVNAASNLANQWAQRDLAAARTWAESLPPGGARDNALGGMVRSWATQDATAAAQWLERFAPGDERDRVVTQFAGTVAKRDPEGALAWAASIGDPDLRGAQLEQLAGRWLQQEPIAARQWIASTDQLTPSARRRIIEQRTANYGPNVNYDE